MCGRFLNRTPASETARVFGTTNPLPNYPPRYNLAPTEGVLVVRFNPDDVRRHLDVMRWGLIPLWADDRTIGNKLFNARSETLAATPAFRDAFAKRRCLIPADGFYEFTDPADRKKKRKDKWLFTKTGDPWFCVAGIWRPDAQVGEAFTMLTMPPGPDIAPYHDRQIAILSRADWAAWLDVTISAKAILKPLPAGSLAVEQVG